MPSLNHIHTYIKFKTRPGWYRCNHPKCSHITTKELVLGKVSICNSCGAEFVLDREDLRRAKPVCIECSHTKEGIAFRKAKALMVGLEIPGVPRVVEPPSTEVQTALPIEEVEEAFDGLLSYTTEEEEEALKDEPNRTSS